MSSFKSAFSLLQKIGKCMMLPVSVLPVAGILLGVGSANFSWLPAARVAGHGGGRQRDLRQPAVAVRHRRRDRPDGERRRGRARRHRGLRRLSRRAGRLRKPSGIETKPIMGIPSIETGVFGGIIVGLIAAAAFNRFYKISFRATRLLRRQTRRADHHGVCRHRRRRRAELHVAADRERDRRVSRTGRCTGVRRWRSRSTAWWNAASSRSACTTSGTCRSSSRRANSPIPPTAVVHGEIARYIAGDPTAGNMSGGYLFKMFGLPAAALAMWRAALPEQREEGRRDHGVRGAHGFPHRDHRADRIRLPLRGSGPLRRPRRARRRRLLRVHRRSGSSTGSRFLTGSSTTSCSSRNPTARCWLLVLGPVWAGVYYGVFSFAIRRFNLLTPGREAGERIHGGRAQRQR